MSSPAKPRMFKEAIGTCADCGEKFKYVQKSRRRVHCDKCRGDRLKGAMEGQIHTPQKKNVGNVNDKKSKKHKLKNELKKLADRKPSKSRSKSSDDVTDVAKTDDPEPDPAEAATQPLDQYATPPRSDSEEPKAKKQKTDPKTPSKSKKEKDPSASSSSGGGGKTNPKLDEALTMYKTAEAEIQKRKDEIATLEKNKNSTVAEVATMVDTEITNLRARISSLEDLKKTLSANGEKK